MGNKDFHLPEKNLGKKNRKKRNFSSRLLLLRRFFSRKAIREKILIFTSFIALVAILQIDLVPQVIHVQLGEPYIGEDIRAPRTVVNTEKTKELMNQAADRAVEEAKNKPEYPMISIEAGVKASNQFSNVFTVFDEEREKLRSILESNEEAPSEQFLLAVRQKLINIDEKFIDFSVETIKEVLILPAEDYERMKKSFRQVYVSLETEEKISPQNINTIRTNLAQYINDEEFLILPQDKQLIRNFLENMVFSNLTRDELKIRQLQEEARRKVIPAKIERGNLILREGDIVTNEHIQILRDLALIENRGNRVIIFFSLTIFSLILMGICLFYIYFFKRDFLKEERQLYLVALVALVVLAVAKAMSLMNLEWIEYLIPLSFAGIVLSFLSDPQLAWVVTTILSLLIGVILDFNLSLTVFYFISGAVSIYSMINITQRKEMIRMGLILSGINLFTVITIGFLFGAKRLGTQLGFAMVAGFNGILSTALANGFLPFLEHLFGLTSPLSILEMANPNLPLLKRLLIEAPGTYHHSILVGNLAEAAADVINADSLLVRVGSYYHDIGKLRRPYFFVENQIANDNPHEKISPNLSTLIITSHVRDGVELARSYGVPQCIIDIIEQHHGTDLVRYFFQKASENLEEEKETIRKSDFSYPGPKPRSKEAALVMLADSVEAAARAMSKPSSARLEALVDKILKERLESGQLDEANLTLRDLDKIKTAFLKVLGGIFLLPFHCTYFGIFHHRIEYPEVGTMERKKNNGGNS